MARELRWVLLLGLSLLALAPDAGAQARKKKRPAPARPEPVKQAEGLPPLYLPGAERARPNAKAGAKGAASKPAQQPGVKPVEARPDPMKAADEVTAAADRLAAQEEARMQFLREHFTLCDLDRNEWISLRESEITLALERSDYRRADRDQDGRLDLAEFTSQQETLLPRLGTRPLPAPEPLPPEEAEPAAQEIALEEPESAPPEPTFRSEFDALRVPPGRLLERYDQDGSAGLDAPELERLFAESGMTLVPELVVAQMDPNDSGQLEGSELVAVAWIASQHLPESVFPAPEPPAPLSDPEPESGDELSEPAPLIVALPPKLEGPTHFGLLDTGDDGFVDEAELRKLQSPARLDLRFKAVLSGMDLDGDGRLSESEFRSALRATDDPLQ